MHRSYAWIVLRKVPLLDGGIVVSSVLNILKVFQILALINSLYHLYLNLTASLFTLPPFTYSICIYNHSFPFLVVLMTTIHTDYLIFSFCTSFLGPYIHALYLLLYGQLTVCVYSQILRPLKTL